MYNVNINLGDTNMLNTYIATYYSTNTRTRYTAVVDIDASIPINDVKDRFEAFGILDDLTLLTIKQSNEKEIKIVWQNPVIIH